MSFSEALQSDLWGSQIRIQALCPGYVYTEFHDTPELAGFKRSTIQALFWLQASEVVAESLRSLEGRQVVCIPGWQYQIAASLARTPLTAGIARGLAAWLYERWRLR